MTEKTTFGYPAPKWWVYLYLWALPSKTHQDGHVRIETKKTPWTLYVTEIKWID